jgi:glycine oxidase
MKVLIIGGGIMGSSIAIDLARAGVQVTVLERSIPGAEASTAAAGMLAPQLEGSQPGAFLDLCLLSRAMYPKWVEQLTAETRVEVDYAASGALQVAFTEADFHGLEATVAWQKASQLRAELLSSAELRTLEPALGPDAVGAAHFPDDHQVDPKKLMRALLVAATGAGVAFRSGYVRGVVEKHGQATGVDLDGEVLEADAVVLAAGSWSGLVAGAHLDTRVVKPARGQMLEFQLRAPRSRHIFKGAKGYVVPRADGRVICGSTMELVGYDKNVTGAGLASILAGATRLMPALADAPVTATWAGLRPWTEDALPILGEGPLERLFLATGHFRNGILLAPVTARLTGQVVRGEKPSLDPRPFRFNRFSP